MGIGIRCKRKEEEKKKKEELIEFKRRSLFAGVCISRSADASSVFLPFSMSSVAGCYDL